MIEQIKEILELPKTAYVQRVMPKNFFDRNFKLTSTEKKLINTPFLPIKATWLAELNTKTANIKAFEDAHYNYTRLPIFGIELSQDHWNIYLEKLISLYHKYIPFPVLLFIFNDSRYIVSAGPKKLNESDNSKRVVEKEYGTPQISRLLKDDIEMHFRKSVNFKNLNRIDLKTTYDSYIAAIVNYKRAEVAGNFVAHKEVKLLDQDLDELRAIEKQIIILRNKLQKSKQVKEKVELQMQLGELRARKKQLEKTL